MDLKQRGAAELNCSRFTKVKQKFAEQLDALPITTVGRDYQARRNLLHYRQNA